ncbi:MAG: MATE family efflux transporter [Planctomycetota bacterium]|nr:MATE family efflux transporter [Planctomycetota bacterium]MDA1113222.1 MATE family efflux transporter [Planctomycetota bacterium]
MKRSKLLVLAGPLVLSFWLRSAFGWIDTIFASTLQDADGGKLGDASIAAIGLTLPLEFLLTACWVGASNGVTARLANAMGEGSGGKVAQIKRAAVKIISGLALFFLGVSAVVWFTSDALGLAPQLAQQFRIYATVLMAGSAISSFWSILPDSLVKAHQDTRATMWAGLASSLTNIALNALFLFVFHWGIFGIALSTVLGRFAGLAYAWRCAQKHEEVRMARLDQQIVGEIARPIRGILALAVPSALGFVLLGTESLSVNFILKDLPDPTSAIAAWSIFDQSVRFLAMPIIALGVALLPLVARLKGQGQMSDIAKELQVGLRAAGIYLIILVLPLTYFVGPLVADALTDTEVTKDLALSTLIWIPLAVAGLAPFMLCRATFDGLQEPRPSLIAAAFRTIGMVIPLVWLGTKYHDVLGLSTIGAACVAFVIGATVSGVGFFFFTRSRCSEMRISG